MELLVGALYPWFRPDEGPERAVASGPGVQYNCREKICMFGVLQASSSIFLPRMRGHAEVNE